MDQFPTKFPHQDIEVRRHLAHLQAVYARMHGEDNIIHPVPRPQRKKRKTPTKVITTIRLSPEVLTAFKATGKGWQSRMNAALREIVAQGKI